MHGEGKRVRRPRDELRGDARAPMMREGRVELVFGPGDIGASVTSPQKLNAGLRAFEPGRADAFEVRRRGQHCGFVPGVADEL